MPTAGRPASGYGGTAGGGGRGAGGSAYRVGMNRGQQFQGAYPRNAYQNQLKQMIPGRNPYQMQPGRMYLGGSNDFDERTGTYRSGRIPMKPDQFGGGWGGGGPRYGVEPWMQRPGMGGRYGGINPGGGYGPQTRQMLQGLAGQRQMQAGGMQQSRQAMVQLMQQMAQQQQMRRMQQAAMARLMTGGGFTY